jgi:hypothetical protein
MIRNDGKLYDGDLVAYFRSVFFSATNLRNPYHNFRHLLHVVWLCYSACEFYKEQLSPRRMRNLLIAAIFHDFNHTGMFGNDDVNIILALRALQKHILPEDKNHYNEIAYMIKATQFPYVIGEEGLSLEAQILRDADLSQAFSVAWIQQVIFGLSEEWNQKPIEVLRMQSGFISKLKYRTDWAKTIFEDERESKIAESNELLAILEPSPVPATA